MSPEEKDKKITQLEQENRALREKIAELERRLGIDSQTSSKPPSSDGFKKNNKVRTKSLREKGKRASGGQFGHLGYTLEPVEKPDYVVEHPTPSFCSSCGCDISGQPALIVIKRQVFDIPTPQILVTQHQVGIKECPCCQTKVKGNFPSQVQAPVQYGVRIKAVAAYLHHQHFVPEDRLSEALHDLFGCRITPGTITNTTKALEKMIEPAVKKLESSVKIAPIKHLDETGFRIGGKTQWLHVVSTETLTWYRVASKRKDIETLADLKGVVEISLEMIYRGLYHFNVPYNKGKATDPVRYFSDPNNHDLGIVKRKRKPNIKLIVAPFPDRQRGQENFFFQNPLTPCSSA